MSQEWQPIDTAPKSGFEFIELFDGERIQKGYWCLLCDPEPSGSYGWAFTTKDFKPTHWRPL